MHPHVPHFRWKGGPIVEGVASIEPLKGEPFRSCTQITFTLADFPVCNPFFIHIVNIMRLNQILLY